MHKLNLLWHRIRDFIVKQSTIPAASNTNGKLPYLDGVRGWASVAVVLGHIGTRLCPEYIYMSDSKPPWVSYMFEFIIWRGSLAVTIFFVLSGRVLALGFLRSSNPEKLASAAIRRPFRLAIPVFVSLLIHYIFQQLNWYDPNIIQAAAILKNQPGGMSWFEVLPDQLKYQNTSMLFAETVRLFSPPFNVSIIAPSLNVYWTLAIEFVNSYLIYLIALITLVVRDRQKWVLYSLIILMNLFNNLHSWLAPFVSGLAIAELSQAGFFKAIESNRKGYLLAIILFITGFLFWTLDFWDYVKPGQSKIETWFASFTYSSASGPHPLPEYLQLQFKDFIIGTCLVALLELSYFLRFVFGNPVSAFIGRISFGIYLLHPIVVTSFSSYIITRVYAPESGYTRDLALFITYLSLFVILIPMSWVFYFIADEPSIKVGRWVERIFFQTDWNKKSFVKEVDGIRLQSQASIDSIKRKIIMLGIATRLIKNDGLGEGEGGVDDKSIIVIVDPISKIDGEKDRENFDVEDNTMEFSVVAVEDEPKLLDKEEKLFELEGVTIVALDPASDSRTRTSASGSGSTVSLP